MRYLRDMNSYLTLNIYRWLFRLLIVATALSSFGALNAQRVENDSITIFLLRGIGRESGHWGTTYSSYVSQNLANASFVLMDLPGAGKYYDQPALPSVSKMVDFLRSEYIERLEEQKGKRVIVATSLAGNVALQWITTYPNDFHGGILLSSSLKGICDQNERVKPAAQKQFVNIFLTDDLAEREREFLSINSNYNTENDSLIIAWQGIQELRPVSKTALLKQTVAGLIYEYDKDFPPLIPMLLIGSEADKIVADTCFCKVAEAIRSDLILHETAGHGIPVDVPEWLATTTSAWINENVSEFEHDPKMMLAFEEKQAEKGKIPTEINQQFQNTVQVSQKTLKTTGLFFSDQWGWIDNEFDWVKTYLKEIKIQDPNQRKQLKTIRRAWSKELRKLKREKK